VSDTTQADSRALDGLTDQELARQTVAGSGLCFAELVGRHGPRLLRFLQQRTRCLQDAEDLLQDTFARAYEHIGSYDPTWKITTWLFTIASRLACSHWRRRSAVPLTEEARLPDTTPGPAQQVAHKEESQNLWSLARRGLSENQYDALWFRYAEGLTVKEISRAMGKTPTHVKVLLHRGRNALGKHLQAAGGTYVPAARRSAGAYPAGSLEGGA